MELIQTGVRIPKALYTEIKIYCAKNDCTIGDFFTTALKNELKKEVLNNDKKIIK